MAGIKMSTICSVLNVNIMYEIQLNKLVIYIKYIQKNNIQTRALCLEKIYIRYS